MQKRIAITSSEKRATVAMHGRQVDPTGISLTMWLDYPPPPFAEYGYQYVVDVCDQLVSFTGLHGVGAETQLGDQRVLRVAEVTDP